MRFYRTALFVAVAVIVVLGVVLVRRMRAGAPGGGAATSDVVASGPPLAGSAAPGTAATAAGAGTDGGGGNPRLQPVHISPAALQTIGVRVGRVRYGPVANVIRTVGKVTPDQRLLATVQVRFPGWVEHEYADQIYQFIRRGQPLVTLYSPEVVTSEEDFLLARQNRSLLSASTVAGVAAGANELLAASRQRLLQWQIPSREIARLERTGKASQQITLDSPVTGYIFERQILPNQYVKAGTTLYTVTGLSRVWVNVQVFQTDAAQLHVGELATVTVDAYPGRVFRGRVDYINPVVEPATLTIPVRLEFANPGLMLKPGMFVNANIHVALGWRLTIPASAVLQTGTQDIAFVDMGGGYLVPKYLELGPRLANAFVVNKGLHAGQPVVTSANFLIDSESQLQAALGAYAPPPPGVGINAAQPVAATARLQLTTTPSPPAKGANQLRASLTAPGGKGIIGAQVTVQFLMPAMPAMNMPAQHARATLTSQGRGVYTGTIRLPSGGNWQVTVTAMRDGQLIASRQLRLRAGGGM